MSACSSQLSASLLGDNLDSASTADPVTQRPIRSASAGRLQTSRKAKSIIRSSKRDSPPVQPARKTPELTSRTATPRSPALPAESVASQTCAAAKTPQSSASTGQSHNASGSGNSSKPRWQQSTAASSRHQQSSHSSQVSKPSFLNRLQAQDSHAASDKQQQHDAKAAEMKAKLQEWREQQKQQKQQQQQQKVAQKGAAGSGLRHVETAKKAPLHQARSAVPATTSRAASANLTSHTVTRQSAGVQKQPLVVRRSSHENLPAALLPPSLGASSHDAATPSNAPMHPGPSVTPAAAVRPALLQSQAARQQTDISASKAAAYSQNKSVSATGRFRAPAPGDVKSDVLPSTTLSREPFAAVQANSMSANAAQSSGSHSSSVASGHRVQRSMTQGLQSHLAHPCVSTAVKQVDDPAPLHRSEPASDSALCSSSGSFGVSSHHTSQQTSHMRLPASGDTAASSSTSNTDAIRVDCEASTTHELADRDGEAVSASKTRAGFLAAAAASRGGMAGPSDDALGKEAGNHAREEGAVQIKAAKATSGAGKAGKQAKNKGPSIERQHSWKNHKPFAVLNYLPQRTQRKKSFLHICLSQGTPQTART
ncbi:TPA: hypothetical protein ACH3X1_005854 [Trebouxia sp. C0004]